MISQKSVLWQIIWILKFYLSTSPADNANSQINDDTWKWGFFSFLFIASLHFCSFETTCKFAFNVLNSFLYQGCCTQSWSSNLSPPPRPHVLNLAHGRLIMSVKCWPLKLWDPPGLKSDNWVITEHPQCSFSHISDHFSPGRLSSLILFPVCRALGEPLHGPLPAKSYCACRRA